ncbi:ABC transporter substrate-binding protein [Blastococcus saxobsidens]|uniref:Peptide/nickel transport system substrate-binding protein n=1 Tax=Blastococcus saxobsidens TaxID=138336 RepID=A0A4Q7Y6I9_9ACTN|nr:ABC transporter substrate-binding protein [Blastococcus saxobsidens]RZU31773.1 peptide/nickel transport system substrate-binding protein [Blastococcus saxobsidens]
MAGDRMVAVLAAATMALAACSSPEGDEGEQTPDADAGPPRGGTLVAAIDSDPGTLNPAITTSGGARTASELLFNGLVGLTSDLEPVPELAESWEVLEAGALYRFDLRDGVTWHDGEPFTSADVIFTFEEMLLSLHARTKASVGAALESIEAPDEDTVEFRFTEPYAPLLLQLDVTEAPILPRHVYEGTDVMTNPANTDPVGTGPFRLESYTPDAELRFSANPDYFEPDLPYLDEVVMRIIPERGNQVVALEAGEVDWLFGVPGPDLARLEESGDYGFLETAVNPGGSNCIMTVSFNLERPMFADVALRRALATALDREQFVERVLFGQGRVAEAPISSGIPFAHAPDLEEMPQFERDEAESLLDEAGWPRDGDGVRTARGVDGVPDGTPLQFGFTHFPSFSAYAELLRAQLREVGAEVKLVPLEPPVFADTVFKARDFDTNIISYCNGADPEIGVKRMYTTANIGPVPFSNAAAYSNPTVDAYFDEARTTVDPEARSDIYRRLQEQLVEDLPYFWIVETESVRAYYARCEGFGPAGHFATTAHCSS